MSSYPLVAREPRRWLSSVWFVILLGPPIGEILMLWLLVEYPLTIALFLSALPVAYRIGFVPALMVGLSDRWLAKRGKGVRFRLLTGMMLGATTGLLPVVPLYTLGVVQGLYPSIFCLVSAAAAFLSLAIHAISQRHFR
jgi:hypothetical protein